MEGSLEFETYEDYPVKVTYNESCKPTKKCVQVGDQGGNDQAQEACYYEWDYGPNADAMSQEEKKAKEDECGFAPVGLYYNDVWEYDLNCQRFWDMACEDKGWEVLHAGARNGACIFQGGKEICTVPSERWHHGSAMFDDKTMLVSIPMQTCSAVQFFFSHFFLFGLADRELLVNFARSPVNLL